MGLFGKLFDKKECSVCGGEIGLLGNRKLADGNLCKNCAQKLSPWMTDRRTSTVEEIRAHLAYREANAQVVPTLNPTKVLGTDTKVYVDERAGKFFVTRHTDWQKRNPDVIDIAQVGGVHTDVREHKEELYQKDSEGKRQRFDPPRYRFSYEFTTTIQVNSPYFQEICFELTRERPERRLGNAYRDYEEEAMAIQQALMPGRAAAQPAPSQPAAQPRPAQPAADGWTCAACGTVNQGKFCIGCGAKMPAPKREFRCDKCGWTPQDTANLPRFCPNCGDPFDDKDVV